MRPVRRAEIDPIVRVILSELSAGPLTGPDLEDRLREHVLELARWGPEEWDQPDEVDARASAGLAWLLMCMLDLRLVWRDEAGVFAVVKPNEAENRDP